MERKTQQRQSILTVFESSSRPLGVQEVLTQAQDQCPGLGIATVYRNIKALLVEDKLAAVELPGGVVVYELPKKQHHHHFSCQNCLQVFDLEGCGFNFQKLVPAGFKLEHHDLILSGLCENCLKK